jgi:hypothetical protein
MTIGREDVIALEPGEEVVLYRNFRTFSGPYVAHVTTSRTRSTHDVRFPGNCRLATDETPAVAAANRPPAHAEADTGGRND